MIEIQEIVPWIKELLWCGVKWQSVLFLYSKPKDVQLIAIILIEILKWLPDCFKEARIRKAVCWSLTHKIFLPCKNPKDTANTYSFGATHAKKTPVTWQRLPMMINDHAENQRRSNFVRTPRTERQACVYVNEKRKSIVYHTLNVQRLQMSHIFPVRLLWFYTPIFDL